MMVTGFSMVLYSRLYLIASGSRTLKFVFAMVVFDAFVFHTPIIVSGAISGSIGVKMYHVVSYLEVGGIHVSQIPVFDANHDVHR
jgi:hypothetical protein